MSQSGIYRIVHITTGREYIGQASNIARRWSKHHSMLNSGGHHAPHLQAAWRMYEPAAFTFEIVELCAVAGLDQAEQRHLDQRQPVFNTAKFARTRRGVPHSPESKAKLSASNKGKKRTPEQCAAISEGLRGNKPSDETRAKQRAAKLGKQASPEAVNNMSKAQKERPRPASEYESRRGRERDPAAVRKSADARRGAKRTPEQVELMKEAAGKMSPENRAKIAQARRDAISKRNSHNLSNLAL